MGRNASVKCAPGSSSTSTPHRDTDEACIATLAVIGLSGPESLRGSRGVGKSALANRLVRPHFLDFLPSDAHLSYLSQADFSCSPVVNGEHWLYWGEASLDSEHQKGPTTHVRVIEHTVFLDDETFRPLGDYPSPSWEPYVRRALCTNLACRGKLMYVCREQLGQEADFPQQCLLPGSQSTIRVDAFCVLFDVSHVDKRVGFAEQASLLHGLLSQAVELKRPVFLAASKMDCADVRGLSDFRKLCDSRKLKNSPFFHSMELSALENVNVTELLYAVAASVDRRKGKLRLAPYSYSLNRHHERLQAIRLEFVSLILASTVGMGASSAGLTYPMFLQHLDIMAHPAYLAFVAEFGPREAERVSINEGADFSDADVSTKLAANGREEGATINGPVAENNRGVDKCMPHASADSPAICSMRSGGGGEECSTISSHNSSPASSIGCDGSRDEVSRPSPLPPNSEWAQKRSRKHRPAPPPPPPKPQRYEPAMSQSVYVSEERRRPAECRTPFDGDIQSRTSEGLATASVVKPRAGRSRSVAPTPDRATSVEGSDGLVAQGTSACRRLWGTPKSGRGLLTRTKSQLTSSASSKSVSKKGADGESQLNTFVSKCIEYIESNGGLEVEGIYRVPGSRTQMAALEKKFKKPANIDLAAMALPVQVVATALKKYLDLLPEPLVPVTRADTLASIAEHSSGEELKLLRQLVERNIPAANITALGNLLRHLWRVHLNSHLNAMDCRNLAKVWSPTLFRPTFENFDAMATSLPRFESATHVLLTRCCDIFSLGDDAV